MSEKTDLTIVRRVEEQFLQKVREHSPLDLTALVAILTRRDTGAWLPVLNEDANDAQPVFPQHLTLAQFIEQGPDVLAEYRGIVIAFEALTLVQSNLITRGSRFYPMEQFFRKIHQVEKLPRAEWRLAKTLFSMLIDKGEIQEKPTAYFESSWLRTISKLFRLTLPALLERYPIEGLLAIVPAKNFRDYLETLCCSLLYVTTDGLLSGGDTLLDLEQFTGITTQNRLCAAFSEVSSFPEGKGILPNAAGFVDLRKELRSGLFVKDFERIKQRAREIKTTLRGLALSCSRLPDPESNASLVPALDIEYWLADQELDDIVAIELSTEWVSEPPSATKCSYYLTLSENSPQDVGSIHDLLIREAIGARSFYSCASLRSLRPLFQSRDEVWLPLSDMLLRLDQPQTLARSAYLTSRWLATRNDSPAGIEQITDQAAIACYVYSLAEPYYTYWPYGEHEHHLQQSYKNFHEQLDRLLNKVEDTTHKIDYHSLKIWWDYQVHHFEQRKTMLEDAVKELESAKRSDDTEQFPAISPFYELFSALLTMFTRTWQPTDIRERLLTAGFDQIASENVFNAWDVCDMQSDPKQPSLLFFVELREFLTLSEKSHMIRIGEEGSSHKAEELKKVGVALGQRIGLNFEKHMALYRRTAQKALAATKGEANDEDHENTYESNIDLHKDLNDAFILPEHEHLWMRCFYFSAIADHAALIYALESKPVQSKVSPHEVTQYVSTPIRIALTGKQEEKVEQESELEVVLFSSSDYDIQERVARRKVNASQSVEFTVAFRKKGNVALLFEYIVKNKQHYPDEAWVHAIDLESQVRWINNPYQYGTQIINPRNHYGRQQELKMILNHLQSRSGDSQRQNFRLRGTRRSGKTSLLIMLRKTIEDLETRRYYGISEEKDAALNMWHPVFYTLQGLSNEADNGKALDSKVFFRSLTKAMCESLHWTNQVIEQVVSRLDADFARSGDIVGAVEEELMGILDELQPDQRILILLDEVDLLGIENETRLFGQLRTIITSSDLAHITWVLTSNRALQAPNEGIESPLHNIFKPVVLRNLDMSEARRLIMEPARSEKIYFEPEAVDSILYQTGCQPFMLQVICSTLVDRLMQEQTAYISRSLADATMMQLLEPGTAIHDQCQFMWTQATDSGRVILALLARYAQGIAKNTLSRSFKAAQFSSEQDAATLFSVAWEDLFANDLVAQDQKGISYLKIPLFRTWLTRRDMDTHYQMKENIYD